MLYVEAFGRFGDCPTQYYYACVSIDSRIYDDFVDAITNLHDKRLKMTSKVKNGVIISAFENNPIKKPPFLLCQLYVSYDP